MLTNFNQKGVTIVEVILVISVILILLTTVITFTNPTYFRAKTRDQKRLSDIQTIDRLITEFRLDNSVYPDSASVIRTSILLPSGRTSLTDPRSGWIVADFIEYTTKLPIDPINDDTYFYAYTHFNDQYEINARLEALTAEMSDDNGNDVNMYELGTNKSLISP